jgi:DNA repair exonuclease SbcCD ATPase subunit/DNA repair exonuclease SbcCD nuclease subunit
MKIAHFADIHWRGLTRHEEYTKAFEIAFDKLRAIKPDIIFIGGDIFHTKTQNITPEVIDRLVWMFRSMARIAPTHIILGNHDGNLANGDRQDAITPIIEAINDRNLFLYKKSGVYYIEDIFTGIPEYTKVNLCVYSCFDKENWNSVRPEHDAINIATFHGSINGSKVDSDMAYGNGLLEAEEELSFFEGYDFTLLGDIHKRQHLALRADKNGDDKSWISYPGSTIQQNFGEEEIKGFLVWDIRDKDDWDVDFVEVENQQPFVTVEWKGTAKQTLQTVKDDRKDLANLKGIRFRLESTQVVSSTEARQLGNELREAYKSELVSIKDSTVTNLSTISAGAINVPKTSLRNDINALMNLYREYIKANSAKHALTEKQITKVSDILSTYIKRINEQETDQTRDVVWSVKSMEFNNTFRYGEGNSIDFDKLEGIVGIFGPNKTGKSSIVGTIMYGLFNTTDRGPMKAAHIINKSKKYCDAKLLINIGGQDYYISRETKRAEAKRASTVIDEEKTSTFLTVTRVNSDGTVVDLTNENGDSRTDTDKILRKLIGTSQDFLLTAFSNQGGINKFIEQGATERKSILNRFMDLEILEKIFKYANDDVAALNARTARYPSGTWDKLIADAKTAIEEKETMLDEIGLQLEDKRVEVDSLRLWVMQNENNAGSVDIGVLSNVQKTIAKLTKDLETGIAMHKKGLSDISRLETLIEETTQKLAAIDLVELNERNHQFELTKQKMQQFSLSHSREKAILETQEKSVRKLTMVPCGDQFPECHFIKDSHLDKELIEDQKKLVAEIVRQFDEVEVLFKGYQNEKISEQIKNQEKLTRDLENAKLEIKHQNSKIETSALNNKQLEDKLTSLKKEEEELFAKINLLESKEFEEKKAEMETAQQIFSSLEKKKNATLVQLGVDKNKLDQLFSDKKECEELIGELKIFESVSSAFHKNGIPAMVLKTQLPAINMELVKILSNVVDFKITLETDTTSNVMDVFIEDGNSKRIIELASGAEKMIASLALRVALINLSSLPKPDMFIVDEGFGVLDQESISKVLYLLIALKSYFKTILVITHVPEVKEIADKILEIQNNGIESKIIF